MQITRGLSSAPATARLLAHTDHRGPRFPRSLYWGGAAGGRNSFSLCSGKSSDSQAVLAGALPFQRLLGSQQPLLWADLIQTTCLRQHHRLHQLPHPRWLSSCLSLPWVPPLETDSCEEICSSLRSCWKYLLPLLSPIPC